MEFAELMVVPTYSDFIDLSLNERMNIPGCLSADACNILNTKRDAWRMRTRKNRRLRQGKRKKTQRTIINAKGTPREERTFISMRREKESIVELNRNSSSPVRSERE